MSYNNSSLKPFLKWAGGKRWLVANYKDSIPNFDGKYVEPFLGSGAIFFYLKPKTGILADINAELITTYNAIKDTPILVQNEINFLKEENPDYYTIRSWRPETSYEQAARFIFLNRTCWNGLYRVNSDGEFNVPVGSKSIIDYPEDDFETISKALRNITIRQNDFKRTIGAARQGDLVFADPPYTVRHNHNGFVKYNEKIFSWDNQVELSKSLTRAAERGCKIMCTNANHESIKELYDPEIFRIREVSRYSPISSKSETRNNYQEIIIEST